jgi:branched-subunit amino acid transport protein AzlD
MISFQTFDPLHTMIGFLTIVLLCFVYPITDSSNTFKILFFIGIIAAIFLPFLVLVTPEEKEKLIMRSGKMVFSVSLVLLFYCYVNRELLQKTISNFFWFCYFLGIYTIISLFSIDVLFTSRYTWVKEVAPFLSNNFGIIDGNFTSPLNYLIKFIFLSLFFRDLFQHPLKKRFFQYLMYALVVFELVQVFVFKSYQGYDSLSSTVKNVFLLGGTGLFMYKLYHTDSQGISLYKNPYFWLTLGLMLPALAEIFLEFIFTKLYQTDLLSFYKLYLVRNASQIVGFTLLIVGVWQAKYLRFLPKEY